MNLYIQRKPRGRKVRWLDQDLTDSPWYIIDEDGNKYNTKEDYDKAHAPKPAAAKSKPVVKKKVIKTEV